MLPSALQRQSRPGRCLQPRVRCWHWLPSGSYARPAAPAVSTRTTAVPQRALHSPAATMIELSLSSCTAQASTHSCSADMALIKKRDHECGHRALAGSLSGFWSASDLQAAYPDFDDDGVAVEGMTQRHCHGQTQLNTLTPAHTGADKGVFATCMQSNMCLYSLARRTII